MARGIEVIVFDGEAMQLATDLSFADRAQIAAEISSEGAARATRAPAPTAARR